MLKALTDKFKEALISVLPVVVIVMIIYFTPLVTLTGTELLVFLVSSVFLVLGIALFNLGADIAMSPMGEFIGSGLTKTRKMQILLPVSFLMGVLVTVAEPDLTVLADQVSSVMNGTVLILCVGAGVGLFLLFGVLKILFRADLGKLLMLFYLILFSLAALLIQTGHGNMLSLSFDSGGVTTGPITVPFLMALGIGIASTIGGKDSNENSFGLIALCSIGPVMAVLFLSILSKGRMEYTVPDYSLAAGVAGGVGRMLLGNALEVLKALLLIVIVFAVLDRTVLKLPGSELIRIGTGLGYTLAGLTVFLTAVSIGYMPVGFAIGRQVAQGSPAFVILFGLVIGCVTVLAEPAVHVLNRQVEEVTGGSVSKRAMTIALSAGVGISIALSMLRAVTGFSLLYYLIPGYILSLSLSLFVPGVYTAIAFDSGGVASGPLTSCFILPMVIGTCVALQGESGVLDYAFGAVAMVAMTPLITIQLLGFRAIAAGLVKEKSVMRRIMKEDEKQIITFDY